MDASITMALSDDPSNVRASKYFQIIRRMSTLGGVEVSMAADLTPLYTLGADRHYAF